MEASQFFPFQTCDETEFGSAPSSKSVSATSTLLSMTAISKAESD